MLKGIMAIFGRKGKAALGAILGIVLVQTLNLDQATAETVTNAILTLVGLYIGGTAVEDYGKHRGNGNGGAPVGGGSDGA